MALVNKIKKKLETLGIKPRKSLGQNFLINEGIYEKIITSSSIERGDWVIEVGPGLGTLTEYLVRAEAKVIGIEKDRQLAGYLRTKFADSKNVMILEEDVLKFAPSRHLPASQSYKIVGNIPYYLTSHLFRIIFERWPSPQSITLIIQKEVAQRIVAKPPEMSLLAVLVQYYSKPKIISYVSRGSFYPIPTVDSAIIRSETAKPNFLPTDSEKFFSVVSAGFSKKRKQITNNLASGLKLDKNGLEKKLISMDIDPKRRAETLTVEEWQKLTDAIFTRD